MSSINKSIMFTKFSEGQAHLREAIGNINNWEDVDECLKAHEKQVKRLASMISGDVEFTSTERTELGNAVINLCTRFHKRMRHAMQALLDKGEFPSGPNPQDDGT